MKNKKKSILFFNARRRVNMAKKMIEYLKNRYTEYQLISSDTDYLDPISYVTDDFVVLPSIESQEFESVFLEVIKKKNIVGIIMWNDKDFAAIEKMRLKIEKLGCKILMPKEKKYEICNNKMLTDKFLRTHALYTPQIYENPDKIKKYPVIIKPKNGAGCVDVYKADNLEEAIVFYKKVPNPIIQEYIEGVHYTVDTYFDRCDGVLCSVPRKRIKVREAEVMIAKIEMQEEVMNVAQQLTKFFSEEGPMNIQVILSVDDGKPYIIDIHCRIGGGSELSIEGGVPLHEWIIDDIIGGEKRIQYIVNDGLIMTRYFNAFFINENSSIKNNIKR